MFYYDLKYRKIQFFKLILRLPDYLKNSYAVPPPWNFVHFSKNLNKWRKNLNFLKNVQNSMEGGGTA
jgi:hypothetical protein